LYFVSFATVFWVDVFVRKSYFDCITKKLNYCEANKGMEIYAWCIMPSHVHLIFKSNIQKPEELLRDFKSFTSKEMIQLIKENEYESRREWLINSFKKASTQNSNNTNYQFWQQHNKPIEL
jgi:putative transposase